MFPESHKAETNRRKQRPFYLHQGLGFPGKADFPSQLFSLKKRKQTRTQLLWNFTPWMQSFSVPCPVGQLTLSFGFCSAVPVSPSDHTASFSTHTLLLGLPLPLFHWDREGLFCSKGRTSMIMHKMNSEPAYWRCTP